jgi:tetratricopeptide (TPR) repeat protein
MATVAFLLGCYEMGDSDVWWHLRGGQWILEQGRVPTLDPFTFGSEGKAWVDIHWAYEVVLALAYRAGGVAAVVLLAASVGAAAFLICLFARGRGWPVPACVLCWMPALVLLAFRLDPRPEIFSLLYLACFLAVLWRVETHPALAWLLPVIQVLWVNTQGLFILGPVLVILYLSGRSVSLVGRYLEGSNILLPGERRWWWHFCGAGVCVAVACLLNPYFLAGARFPFDLFPKVANSSNIYKQYIDELMSPRDFVNNASVEVAGKNWFFLCFYFLLLALPISFLFPAAWRAWVAGRTAPTETREKVRTDAVGSGSWLGALVLAAGLLAWSTLTLSGTGAPDWMIALGENVPILLLLVAAGAAILLFPRSAEAAALSLAGGIALSAWIVCLQRLLLGEARGLSSIHEISLLPFATLILAGGVTIIFALRWRASLFRILLAAAFAYLGLQALQNWSRFALVAGTVLAWNVGEWVFLLTAASTPNVRHGVGSWCLRGALASVLGIWIVALANDRFYIQTGEPRHFGFHEQPLEFAHEAVVFAGQPGLPDHALVYGLGQTGLYVFHNSPRCKPFIDGRLEMPDRETFETYTRIEQRLRDNDPGWERDVAALGNPIIVLEHRNNHGAEALLLTHANWQCIYYDAIVSIFVFYGADGGSDAFRPVDFAVRHFQHPETPSIPNVRGAAAREEKALFNLATAVRRSPDAAWRWRIPALLCALDRARIALEEEPTRADVWVLLGNSYWNLIPDLSAKPPTPGEEWDLERCIHWAQATYCHRRALELGGDDAGAWRYLFSSYRARGMLESEIAAHEQWMRFDPKVTAKQREQFENLRRSVGKGDVRTTPNPSEAPARLNQLLQDNRTEAAVQLLQEAERQKSLKWAWKPTEQAAGLYMHLGHPADARRLWETAKDSPSRALRESRIASTYWVEQDLKRAIDHFGAARLADPQLGEVWWALAMIHAQVGDGREALKACRQGLALQLNERQRCDLEALQHLLPAESSGY